MKPISLDPHQVLAIHERAKSRLLHVTDPADLTLADVCKAACVAPPPKHTRCPRCNGSGDALGVRGDVPCGGCDGTGEARSATDAIADDPRSALDAAMQDGLAKAFSLCPSHRTTDHIQGARRCCPFADPKRPDGLAPELCCCEENRYGACPRHAAPEPKRCHYCGEPAEHSCAVCDRPCCGEHSIFGPDTGEDFCAPLYRTSARLAESLFLCTPADRMPRSAVEQAKAEGWDPAEAGQ